MTNIRCRWDRRHTPLGASSAAAQENVAVSTARQIHVAFLDEPVSAAALEALRAADRIIDVTTITLDDDCGRLSVQFRTDS